VLDQLPPGRGHSSKRTDPAYGHFRVRSEMGDSIMSESRQDVPSIAHWIVSMEPRHPRRRGAWQGRAKTTVIVADKPALKDIRKSKEWVDKP